MFVLNAQMKQMGFILALSASLWLALFTVASAEVIQSFDADILIAGDSSFHVTETIEYNFESDRKHGIYRNIKDKHAQPATAWYKDRYIKLTPVSVKRNGLPEPYALQDYDGLSVRIGDANEYVTGKQIYEIVYRVDGGLAQYDSGETELYWNVTGNEWEVPINQVTVQVRAADEVELLSGRYCYADVTGSNQVCAQNNGTEKVATFKSDLINPGQELTVAQTLQLTRPPVVLEKNDLIVFFIPLIISCLIVLAISNYRWKVKYKTNLPIVAQYEPLSDFKPMFSGVLIDNVLGSNDITASLVYLAQQGFISIRQTTDKVFFLFETLDYEIELLRRIDEVDTMFQKEILSLLFEEDNRVGKTVKLSQVKRNDKKIQKNLVRIHSLKKAARMDLVERGFLEKASVTTRWSIALTAVTALLFFVLLDASSFLSMILISGFVIVFVSTDIRSTKKGYEAKNYLEGFKKFLSVTERERYKFHNAPSLSPQQFMEYLPYAIAFGVEKEWAKVFKDIQIDNPSWFQSNTPGGHFNAIAFTADIGAFSSSFTGSTSSSGSSGGGSAGGGSGGGGGGSW